MQIKSITGEKLNTERYAKSNLSQKDIDFVANYLDFQVGLGSKIYVNDFPDGASKDHVYPHSENIDWTDGFWTGILLYSWEMFGKKEYFDVYANLKETFADRVYGNKYMDTHDIGFVYSLSTVADYKLTGDEYAKKISIAAADALCTRFHEKGQFIQAWLEMGHPDEHRFIVDCFMNLPLLLWAHEETGDEKYLRICKSHFQTAYQHLLRDDGSSNHTFFMNQEDGSPLYARTHQGLHDDSCWTRGQGWVIYGPLLVYTYLKDERILDSVKKSANYYLNRLPEDLVPYWDFEVSGDEPRDSSAASLAVCGLLELVKHVEGEEKKYYQNAADNIMKSLIDNYLNTNYPDLFGLLEHATQSVPHNWAIDEFNLWGDYFFAEAVARYKQGDKFTIYW